MKVIACALMLRVKQAWFMLYMGGDVGLFWCYKMLMGDLRHWIPLEGVWSWIATLFLRIIIQIVVDFTLLIQFRRKLFQLHVPLYDNCMIKLLS